MNGYSCKNHSIRAGDMKHKDSEKYNRIITAATKVFAKKGFFKAKVSEIAREAGIADGTVYIYFDHKDDILIALFEEKMSQVLDNMKEQLSLENDPLKKIERFALLSRIYQSIKIKKTPNQNN